MNVDTYSCKCLRKQIYIYIYITTAACSAKLYTYKPTKIDKYMFSYIYIHLKINSGGIREK